MSYAKTIFFIPVWFDDFKKFTSKFSASDLWYHTEKEKISPGYLFHYATNIAKDNNLFESFSLKDVNSLKVYMYNEKIEKTPVIEEVRFSCFATGIGFMEFWVSYLDMTESEIADFSYLFKKAKKKSGKEILNEMRDLHTVAESLLPQKAECKFFFSASAEFKCECNCLHFIHKDDNIPDENDLKNKLYHLCRSYNSTMQNTFNGDYDVLYEATKGDYWCGSTEGMVNLVYDYESNSESSYYLHNIKPKHLSVDYYFMYLLLLNQKYSALQYIYMVANVIDKPSKEIEILNKRIIQLKNVFSFNVISDDQHFQNLYSKMFGVLEIRNLLADVIENEKQTEFLQSAKHSMADRLSNKYLLGISILSLFSALIDSASYFDRFGSIKGASTVLSIISVSIVLVLCVCWAINSIKK